MALQNKSTAEEILARANGPIAAKEKPPVAHRSTKEILPRTSKLVGVGGALATGSLVAGLWNGGAAVAAAMEAIPVLITGAQSFAAAPVAHLALAVFAVPTLPPAATAAIALAAGFAAYEGLRHGIPLAGRSFGAARRTIFSALGRTVKGIGRAAEILGLKEKAVQTTSAEDKRLSQRPLSDQRKYADIKSGVTARVGELCDRSAMQAGRSSLTEAQEDAAFNLCADTCKQLFDKISKHVEKNGVNSPDRNWRNPIRGVTADGIVRDPIIEKMVLESLENLQAGLKNLLHNRPKPIDPSILGAASESLKVLTKGLEEKLKAKHSDPAAHPGIAAEVVNLNKGIDSVMEELKEVVNKAPLSKRDRIIRSATLKLEKSLIDAGQVVDAMPVNPNAVPDCSATAGLAKKVRNCGWMVYRRYDTDALIHKDKHDPHSEILRYAARLGKSQLDPVGDKNALDLMTSVAGHLEEKKRLFAIENQSYNGVINKGGIQSSQEQIFNTAYSNAEDEIADTLKKLSKKLHALERSPSAEPLKREWLISKASQSVKLSLNKLDSFTESCIEEIHK